MTDGEQASAAAAGEPVDPDVRVIWTLVLRAETALAVAGATAGTTADLLVARDGAGRPYIPGTSWAGVLRASARRFGMPEPTVRGIFGFEDRAAPADSAGVAGAGRASRLTVDDTVVIAGPVELRTGVGIDRLTGAAADRIRYDREVLPPGTDLDLRLRYDGPAGALLDDLRELLCAVRAEGLRVGGATRRGLGQLTCASVTEQVVDLRSRGSLLGWFCGDTDVVPLEPLPVADRGVLCVAVSWRQWRPVVVGAGAPAENAQLIPVMTRSATRDGLVPVLPGSSVKGVLRSLAERVARTVLDPDIREGGAGRAEPAVPEPAVDFVRAMDELCQRVPALEALFGSRRRAGALSVPDVAAETPVVDAAVWADYLAGVRPATDADGSDGSDGSGMGGGGGGRPGWDRARSHVAVDRWTGGAAEQLLFTVQELAGVRWPPIRLEVDLPVLYRALGGDERRARAALVLLGCTVGLLLDGDAGFGHGTSRGLGEVEVTEIQVRLPDSSAVPGGRGLPELPDTFTDTVHVTDDGDGDVDVDVDELREFWWMWLADLAPDGGWVDALGPAPGSGG